MPQSVGILTFHDADNYGAVLQAYGLVKAVQELGHSVEIIDYCPATARKLYNRLGRNPRIVIARLARRWKFRSFRKKLLPLTKRKYLTPVSLRTNPPAMDCVICGSDQVWNVQSYRGFDPPFFLDFVKGTGVTKASYAATFGGANNFSPNREQIAELLRGFDYLSVRDQPSQDVVQELIDCRPQRVLDPSFLTDFGPITPPSKFPEPYIVAYAMERTEQFESAVTILRNKLKLPVLSIGAAIKHTHACTSAGPLEWLSLIRNASFVLTNSFHGVCFSIIGRKNFLVVPHSKWPIRIVDLLDWCRLSNRIVPNNQMLEDLEPENLHINYELTEEILATALNDSRAYLREVLRG